MRLRILLSFLALTACHDPDRVSVDVAFDVDAGGGFTSAKCIASTGNTCQIDFRGATPRRAVLQIGEMRHFKHVGPGAPVCIAAKAADLAGCQPIRLRAGYARIRKERSDSVALAQGHARA